MTLQYSPFDSLFDAKGMPTAQGQQLLAQIGWALASVHSVPAGGTSGQALVKTAATDYALGWADVVAGSGTFTIDDGTATAGGSFVFDDGGA